MHTRMGAALALALAAWLATPVAPAQADDHERASGECTIVGTPGPDVLRGTKHADFICGLGGDDKILGRGGDDVLQGGGGDDLLVGGPGNDVLGGGRGDDTLNGLDDNVAVDKLRCGRGDDTAKADPPDIPRPHCEHIQQDHAPTDITLRPSSVAENQPGGTAVGTLAATDSDAGDTQTFALVPGTGSADNGSFTILGTTLRTAVSLDHETTPTQSVRVRSTDSGGLAVEKALTVTVTDADDPPVAVGDTKTVTEDAAATAIDVLANDTDADGGPKAVQSVTQPAHGAVVIQAGGIGVTYAPAANYCNTPTPPTDDFTYTLNGGSTAAVKVTVTCVDDPAVANDDSRTVAEDSGATVIDVLANDADVEGDPFSVTAVTQPAHGAVTFTANDVSYTPNANYCNNPPPFDTFDYTITGGDTATVSVTVSCVNDPPVAVDDAKTATEDTPLTFPAGDLTTNDTDIDGDPLTVTAVSGSVGGTASLSAGSVTFTPAADLCTPSSAAFDYTVSDGTATDTGHVTVDVTCVDDPPVANDDSKTVAEDSSATVIDVLANDTDVENDPITVAGVTQPAHGTTTFTANDVSYTPSADYCNTPTPPFDTFDYTVNGGDTATVSVSVTCVNDAPVLDLDTAAGGTGSSTTFHETSPHAGTGVLIAPNASESDVDDANIESATVTLTSRPDGSAESLSFTSPAGSGITGTYAAATGVLALTGTATSAQYAAAIASVRYDNTANPPNAADRTVTVVVNDGDTDSNSTTATVQVVPLNVPPDLDLDTATADNDATASFVEDGPAVGVAPNPSITDTDDTDMEGATVVLTSRPDGNGNESLTFTIPGGSGITAPGGYDPATGTITFTGTSSKANYAALLGSVAYADSSDTPATTARSITFVVNDGNDDSPLRTSTVSVTATNDPPVNTVPGAQAATEDTAKVITGISVADPDDASLTVTLSVTNGTLSLASTSGLTFTTGDGTADVAMEFSGAKAALNAALTSITYDPAADFNGSETLTITTEDAALSDTDTVTINVAAVNDPPVVDLNGVPAGIDSSAAFTEDSAPANPGSGPAALAPNATVTDVDDANLSSATITLTNHPDGAAESLTVATAGTSITGTYNATTGVLALSGTDTKAHYQQVIRTLAYDNTSNTPSTPDRDVTVEVTGAGALDSATAHATVTVTATNDAPTAVTDTFNGADAAVGNTPLAVGTTQAEPRKAVDCTVPDSCSVLTRGTDDSDPDGPGPLVVGPTGAQAITTADGGKVTLETDGNFTYYPKAGASSCTDTSDSFSYTLSDGGPNGTATGTVNITLTGCVWYVDSSVAGPGTGTGSDPFKALSGVNGVGGVGDADGPGDTIMVLDAATYTGGLSLENNQLLRSERAGLTVGGAAIVTAAGASNPTISNVSGSALVLASGNTIQGIDLGATTAGSASLSGTNVGTATMNTVTSGAINNPSGGAVDLSNGTLAMAFTTVSSTNAGGDGIRLDNAAGTFTGSGGSLQNAGGQDVDLSGDNSGDTVAFTYDGTITDDVGQLVSIANQDNGTKDFNGLISDGNDGDGNGISLSANPVATIRFDGGLILSTGTNAAFTATGGGTVVVNEPNGVDNSITTTTGTALNVANTVIGTDGLNFTSISSNGAANGIVLNSTGAVGHLSVTGSGGTCTAANQSGCTGGEIKNTTGADSSTSTPGGTGIVLKDTTAPSFTRIWLHDNSNYAIRGTDVAGLTLDTSVINGTNGTNGTSPFDDSSVWIDNLTGSASVTASAVSGGFEDNFRILNSAGSLNRLTISNTTIGANSTAGGNDGVSLGSTGSAGPFNATIQNSTFTSAGGDLLQLNHGGSGTGDLVLTNNAFSNNHPAIATGGGGLSLFSDGAGGNTTMSITGNSFRDAVGNALTIVKTTGAATQTGTFSNNTIGVNGLADSGSTSGDGIKLQNSGGGALTWTVSNNTIRQYGNFGVDVLAGGGAVASAGAVNTTITGNTVAQPGTLAFPKNGIQLNIGTVPGDTYAACGQITGNTVNGSSTGAGTDIRVRQRQNTTVRLPGYAGAAGDVAAVQTFLSGNNPTGPPTVSASVSGTGGGFVGGPACP